MNKNVLILSISALMLSGCASFYRRIDPPTQDYTNISYYKDLTFAYNDGILHDTGNRKYAKKAKRKGISLTAVKITNNSNHDINFNDMKLISDSTRLEIIQNAVFYSLVKQKPAWYLFYCLAVFNDFQVTPGNIEFTLTDNTSGTGNYPGFYPLGVPFAAGNMIVASGANKHFLNELTLYDLTSAVIKPNQTVFGLICYRNHQHVEIKIEGQKNIQLNDSEIEKQNKAEKKPFIQNSFFYINDNDTLLFKMKENSFQEYYNRIIKELDKDNTVLEYIMITHNYGNGNIKTEGIKIRRDREGDNSDWFFPVGVWRNYYPNGKIKNIISYNISGEKYGISEDFDENGNPVKTEWYEKNKLRK